MPHSGHAMTGLEFERYCAKLLQKNGYRNVTVTKGSGDQGIDIIAYRRRKKVGVQCKLYERPVGNKAVQEAYTGKAFYDCDEAMVMTNATFTKPARAAAERTGVLLWEEIALPRRRRVWPAVLALLAALCVAAAVLYDPTVLFVFLGTAAVFLLVKCMLFLRRRANSRRAAATEPAAPEPDSTPRSPVPAGQPVMTDAELERFAMECNALLRQRDETE